MIIRKTKKKMTRRNKPTSPLQRIAFLHRILAFACKSFEKAIRYSTVIFCVLHENPGSENGKTRGHLERVMHFDEGWH